jgi:hypothetical protein
LGHTLARRGPTTIFDFDAKDGPAGDIINRISSGDVEPGTLIPIQHDVFEKHPSGRAKDGAGHRGTRKVKHAQGPRR